MTGQDVAEIYEFSVDISVGDPLDFIFIQAESDYKSTSRSSSENFDLAQTKPVPWHSPQFGRSFILF